MTDINSSKACKPSYPEGAKAHLLVFVGLVTVWLYMEDKLCVGRKAKPEEGPAICLCNSIISRFFHCCDKTLGKSNLKKRDLSWQMPLQVSGHNVQTSWWKMYHVLYSQTAQLVGEKKGRGGEGERKIGNEEGKEWEEMHGEREGGRGREGGRKGEGRKRKNVPGEKVRPSKTNSR